MNEIKTIASPYFGKGFRKGAIQGTIVGLILLAIFGIVYFVLADNQPTVDPITTYNNQINEIDKKLMENSQSYNEIEQKINGFKEYQTALTTTNTELRNEKEKLTSEKEAKLLGK